MRIGSRAVEGEEDDAGYDRGECGMGAYFYLLFITLLIFTSASLGPFRRFTIHTARERDRYRLAEGIRVLPQLSYQRPH